MSGNPTWDALNDTCGSLSGWSTGGTGTFSHAVTTVDGRVCIRLTVAASGTHSAYAWHTGVVADNYTLEATYKYDNFDTAGGAKASIYRRDSTRKQMTSGDYISDTAGEYVRVLVGTIANTCRVSVDKTIGNWQTIRVVCSGTDASLYFNGKYCDSTAPLQTVSGYTPDGVGLTVAATADSPARTVFFDFVGVSATLMDPTPAYPTVVSGASDVVVMARQYPGGTGWTTSGGGVTVCHTGGQLGTADYCMRLVPTTDAQASRVRVQTSTGVQSAMKHKTF